MVAVFTIAVINYLVVSLFYDLVRPFCIYICTIKFFGYTICLVSSMARKAAMPSPKIIHHIVVAAHHAKLFSNKIFSLNSILQIVGLWLYFDFFLNSGLYYIVL